MSAPEDQRLARLFLRRKDALDQRHALIDKAEAEKRNDLTPEEDEEFRALTEQVKKFDERIAELSEELRGPEGSHETEGAQAARRATARNLGSNTGSWATRTATALRSMAPAESRAVVSGSIDVPQLVETNVSAIPYQHRLIDLLVNRQTITSNAFTYVRQTVRTNNAAPVADNALKPTSVFTVTSVEDRLRVIAHLSEAIPLRFFEDDVTNFENWLNKEMSEGVLNALEAQVVSGSGSGENFTGILETSGTTAVPFATDMVTTLRKARTAMQLINERPNAIVLNPADAEVLDLTRVSTGGAFLIDGYEDDSRSSTSDNVFGSSIDRVVSNSVPAGTAILGDWSQVRLYIRSSIRIDVDAGGALFTNNQAKLRAEGRYGIGVLRPRAFAIIETVDPTP